MSTIEKSARLVDVAKRAGVSRGTVSNVFSHPELVRDEVREHVREVAKQLGYRGPDPKGRLLRAGKFNAIGVATAEPLGYFFDDPFARELMMGISAACDAHGAGLSLVSAMDRERLGWSIDSALVDGFVLLCIEGGERLVELTRARQLPFVALALGKPDPTISAIGIDDVHGGELAARHLVDLGHRDLAILALEFTNDHVGFISDAEIDAALYSTSRDRMVGYRKVFREAGIDPASVPVFETHHDQPTVSAALEAIFAIKHPTALLCMSDRIAMLAIDWLKARGLSVPTDVSVIGFDGVPESARATPPLTTIAQPIAAIGRRAVELILEADGDIHRETLPLELVVRASTAKPAQ